MKEAQKLLAKGQIDKAIAEWQKISAEFPDGNTYNYIGDLYIKKGDKQGAIDEFHKAAKIYTDEGFALKALAIHKKVLNLNPRDAMALIALGELNEEKKIHTDAIKFYLAAADVLSKENKKDSLLNVYDKILNLAPKNIKLRIKVSELFSKEGFIPEAAKEYCNIAELFSERGDAKSSKEYLTKAFEIQPGNRAVLIKLSEVYEKSGEFDKAAEYIQTAIDKTGEDADMSLRIANLKIAMGNIEEATEKIQAVLKMEPSNVEARKKLADLYQQSGDITSAWDEYKQVIDSLIDAEKYSDAIAILGTFKDFEPIENRKKLVSVFKMKGDEDNAFKELYDLHDMLANQMQTEEAIEVLKDALVIKPESELARKKLADMEAELHKPAKQEAPPPQEEAVEEPAFEEPTFEEPVMEEPAPAAPEPVAAAAPQPQKSLQDILNEVDVLFRYGLYNDAKPMLEEQKSKHPTNIDLHARLKQLYVETNDLELAVTECLVLNTLYEQKGDAAAAKGAIQEAAKINPSDPRLAGKVEVEAAKPSIRDHTEELAEADFYTQQGFYDEAANIYKRLMEMFPDEKVLSDKLDEIEAMKAGAAEAAEEGGGITLEDLEEQPAPTPFAGEAEESELFDVSSLLDAADSGEGSTSGLDEDVLGIFDAFKKGLSQEIANEDAATHYDLGIAYKEMGIVDDAIKEFQIAQRDPNYYTQAATMIGLCLMSKGAYDVAAEAFSTAMKKVPATDEKRWSLTYDLALAYELGGRKAEALGKYKEVLGWDPSFRDVSAKVQALSSGAEAAPAAPKQQPKPAEADAKEEPKAAPKDRSKSRVSYI